MSAEALLLLAAMSIGSGEAVTMEATPPAGRLLRFVGEQLAVDQVDCITYPDRVGLNRDSEDAAEGEANKPSCHVDDLQLRARYRVVHDLDGSAGETVEFLVSGWTNYYANSRHALLYVLDSPHGVFLLAGKAESVYPTSDGDWASCDADMDAETLEFAGNPVFGRTNGMSPYGIAQRFPPTDYVVIGDKAYCIRGRRLQTLVADFDRDVQQMRASGFPFLPELSPEVR